MFATKYPAITDLAGRLRIMKQDQESVTRTLQSAARALETRDYPAAHEACMGVLKSVGPHAEAFYLLGILTAAHDNHGKAAEIFDRAIALDASDPRFHAHRARALLAINRRDLARQAADEAAKLGPRDALTWDTVGVVYTRLGDHDAAIRLFESAVAANPEQANYHYNLAASRQFAGDFEGAEIAYRAAIALEPDMYKAHSALVQLRKQTADDHFITEMTRLFEKAPDDADRALHLGHALAKTCEDLGDYPAALDWLRRAKQGKRAATDYDAETDRAIFAAARRSAGAVEPDGGWPSDRPIFVVGLPRTGTTLVDRILSSHSQVDAAGELSNFATLTKQMTATPGPFVMEAPTLDAAARLDMSTLGRAYEESTAALVGSAARFTDKMPLNILYAGLIHRALPHARIVCLRRHPMDACLSNYRQLFATSFSYYNYAHDLADCGRYYLMFDQLVKHWQATLPTDRFTTIAYEDIVDDLEGSARALIAHCDLDWEPECLEFHAQSGAVATASSVQVRQPIYSSSVGRWKRYGEALQPLRDVLEAGGVIDADGEWQRSDEATAGTAPQAV
jgi:tetratricopeptide (TPR) repeat protein